MSWPRGRELHRTGLCVPPRASILTFWGSPFQPLHTGQAVLGVCSEGCLCDVTACSGRWLLTGRETQGSTPTPVKLLDYFFLSALPPGTASCPGCKAGSSLSDPSWLWGSTRWKGAGKSEPGRRDSLLPPPAWQPWVPASASISQPLRACLSLWDAARFLEARRVGCGRDQQAVASVLLFPSPMQGEPASCLLRPPMPVSKVCLLE